MDIRDEKNFVFDIRLAKLTGLYQILDPGTIRFRSKNVYHVVIAIIMLYMYCISITLNVSGFYYFADNIHMSVEYFWHAEMTLFIMYKIWIVIDHSNDLWNCLSVTWYGFYYQDSGTDRSWIVGEYVRCGPLPCWPSCI